MNPTATSFFEFYRRWTFVHSLLNIVLLAATLMVGNPFAWMIISAFSFAYYVYKMRTFIPALPLKLGYANLVTIVRLGLLFVLVFIHRWMGDLFLFLGFLVVILMDGLDGFIARKYNHTSDAGEYLDMETDAFLALFLCWLHFSENKIEYWILVPGLLKYAYSVVFTNVRQLAADYPPKKVRAAIAAAFFFSLLTPFILTEEYFYVLCFATSLLIGLSFGLAVLGRAKVKFR